MLGVALTHALPHQEPPRSSAFVATRRVKTRSVKTLQGENNQFRGQAFSPRGAARDRFIPADQRSNEQVLLWAIAVCRL